MTDQTTHSSTPPVASGSVPLTEATSAAPSAAPSAARPAIVAPTITIPQGQNDEIAITREAVVSPIQKKTGTRSTFCTRIKPCTRAVENKEEPLRSPGFLQMLGVCQQTNYGDTSAKDDVPVQQAYY
ncbi:hypothetical protein DFQ26_006332 [Actinomortierella ambigua]|nr:hypothetical protein DFQ26_006332 [Actinomortierella ambigua]